MNSYESIYSIIENLVKIGKIKSELNKIITGHTGLKS